MGLIKKVCHEKTKILKVLIPNLIVIYVCE